MIDDHELGFDFFCFCVLTTGWLWVDMGRCDIYSGVLASSGLFVLSCVCLSCPRSGFGPAVLYWTKNVYYTSLKAGELVRQSHSFYHRFAGYIEDVLSCSYRLLLFEPLRTCGCIGQVLEQELNDMDIIGMRLLLQALNSPPFQTLPGLQHCLSRHHCPRPSPS